MTRRNQLIAFLGPSATGKTSLLQELATRGILHEVVSYSTREPRPGEVDGKSYNFTTLKNFHNLIEAGALAEYIEFSGHFYGLAKADIETALELGPAGVVVEPTGFLQLKATYPDRITSVFLKPPSKETLVDRIRTRQPGISDEAVETRMIADEHIQQFEDQTDIKLEAASIPDWIKELQERIGT